MPLKVQPLNYWDVLIEFDSAMGVEWVAQNCSRLNGGWGLHATLNASPLVMKMYFRSLGGWVPPGRC